MKSQKFSLLFFGSDTFSVRVIKFLLDRNICPLRVVSRPGTLLDKFSATNNLYRHRWPLEKFHSDPFNIGLVASFGDLIDEETINRFEYGLFNIHPSLLPRYRGSTPVQAAIKDGVSETGCTIMKIPPIPKFDVGDIILQEKLSIRDREYALNLRDRLADLSSVMTEKLLLNYDLCMREARPQGLDGVSYARKLKDEQGLIKFRSESSSQIDRQVRAYTGFINLYSYCLNGLKVRLKDLRDPREVENYRINDLISSRQHSRLNVPAGTIFLHKIRRILCIKCADDKWLSFDSMTPEFKSTMSAIDFYNGYLSRVSQEKMITDF